VILFSCNKAAEKSPPTMTIGKFSKQQHQMQEVIRTLMAETDIKKMHKMADAVENSRAVLCSPIGEECNYYYQLLNRMIKVTKDGTLSKEDRAELETLNAQFAAELEKAEKTLTNEWVQYLGKDAKVETKEPLK
jgi:hypothetical protein